MSAASFSFTLQPDPAPPGPATATSAPAAGSVPVARPMHKRGLLRPVRRDGKGGFARTSGDALLEEKLGNLLELDGLPWDPARSALLGSLRHMDSTNVIRAFAHAYVCDAVGRYLPELRVEDVTVSRAKEGVLIEVRAAKVRDPSQIITASRPFG